MLHAKTITCTKLDGSTVEITVKALPLSQLEGFFGIQGDQAATLTLTTGLTVVEQDSLIGASSLALLEAADELNDPLARRWLARQTGLLQRIREAKEKLGVGDSPSSSPNLSSADAQTTGTPPSSSPGRALNAS